jgi:hypothetical protein
MRKQVISFKVPQVKQRNHYVLFAENTPFKPKRVERKDGYKRKPKFTNREADWQ